MIPVFLSYSRKDIDDVNIIAKILIVGGIRTWQDVESLTVGASEAQIRRAISEECCSLLFYATDNGVSSDFIRKVEIKDAYKRVTQDDKYSIVPLFKKPIDEVNDRLKGVIPVNISTFSGAIINASTGLLAASQKVRKIFLKKLLKFQNEQNLPISIMTKQNTPVNIEVLLDFNWSKIFTPDELLTQTNWDGFIRQALIDAKDSLIEAGYMDLKIISKAHLSVGFAVGFIFRRVTGFKLNILQGDQWWSNHDVPANNLQIKISNIPNDIKSADLGIDISISQDVQLGLNNFVSEYGMSFRAILRFTPESGFSQSAILNGSDAIAVAKNIADNIRKAHAEYTTANIHIFAAIPLGLAYLIGTELNACGRIYLYECNNSTRIYFPSWIIEGTD